MAETWEAVREEEDVQEEPHHDDVHDDDNDAVVEDSDQDSGQDSDQDYNMTSDEEDDDDDDEDYNPDGNRSKKRKIKNMTRTAMVIMKYGLSYRESAELIDAALTDLELANENDTSLFVDHSKLFREVKKLAKTLVAKRNQEIGGGFQGLYFDGKQEQTLVPKNVFIDGGRSTEKEVQDHYTIVEEPGSKFVCHINALGPEHPDITADSKAEAVAEQLLETLRQRGADLDKINTVGRCS